MNLLPVAGRRGLGGAVGACLVKYHTSTLINTNPKMPPTAPPAMAPMLELVLGEGVAVGGWLTGGGVGSTRGGTVGGGGAVIICVVSVGAAITMAVPEFGLLSTSLEFRLSVLMFVTAALA